MGGGDQGRPRALLTFPLLLQFALGFKAAHLEGVELKYMGQQLVGQYPIHFHLAGDLDERGGYDPPTYIRDLSIHHTFSRCVTVHGSNGLLVSTCWKGSLSRDLGHAEKGDLGLCLLSPASGVNLDRLRSQSGLRFPPGSPAEQGYLSVCLGRGCV